MTVIALEGAAIDAPPAPTRGVSMLRVTDEGTAAVALRQALTGTGLVLLADAPRAVLDVLYDDLRRITRVEVRTTPRVDAGLSAILTDEERHLLRLLAAGKTLQEAATELHLSPRTGDRRLASARSKLGAATTTAAIAAVAADPSLEVDAR